MGIQRRSSARRVEAARPINAYFHQFPASLQHNIRNAQSMQFRVIEGADYLVGLFREFDDSADLTYPDRETFVCPIQWEHVWGTKNIIKSIHSPSYRFKSYEPVYLRQCENYYQGQPPVPVMAPMYKNMVRALEQHPLINKPVDLFTLCILDRLPLATQVIYPHLFAPTIAIHYWEWGRWTLLVDETQNPPRDA